MGSLCPTIASRIDPGPTLGHSLPSTASEHAVTRIDFYIVPEQGADSSAVTACRVAEKAYEKGHSVHLHLTDSAGARALDTLLWTFRDGSFVPHQVLTGEPINAPVTLGWQDDPPVPADVLINLSAEVPAYFSRFQRLAEIVGPDAEALSASRERYRFYRERGYPLHNHRL